jgi:hypothetical protein
MRREFVGVRVIIIGFWKGRSAPPRSGNIVSELQFRTLYFTLALTSAAGNYYLIISQTFNLAARPISSVDAAILAIDVDMDEHLKTGHRF